MVENDDDIVPEAFSGWTPELLMLSVLPKAVPPPGSGRPPATPRFVPAIPEVLVLPPPSLCGEPDVDPGPVNRLLPVPPGIPALPIPPIPIPPPIVFIPAAAAVPRLLLLPRPPVLSGGRTVLVFALALPLGEKCCCWWG